MGDEHTTAPATAPAPVGAEQAEPTTEAPPPTPAAVPPGGEAAAPATPTPAADAGVPDGLAVRTAERDEYLALAQRTRADFENYRKRVARDAAAAESRAVGRLVRELLPAVDNLERALAAAGAGTAGAGTAGAGAAGAAGAGRVAGAAGAAGANGAGGQLVDGLRLVRDDIHGALARVGVASFASQGERFDPELHEAIAQRPQDGAEPGTVVEVYQEGYRLGDSLIRPARVVVAAPPATAAAPPAADAGATGDGGT